MAVGDVFEQRINWVQANQRLATVWHWVQSTAAGTGDQRSAINLIFGLNIQTPLLALLSNDILIESIETRGVGAVQSQALILPVIGFGAKVLPAMPPNLTVVMTEYSTGAWRKGIGRTYYSGIAEDDQDSGTITQALYDAFQTFGGIVSGTITHIPTGYVFNRCMYNAPTDTGTPIVTIKTRPRIKSLRSRTVGQGT